ncbi:MAG: pilus assembly protein [Planctomycetia bacterium]|nr:pilus assembly protein [Planctomycetia bacterium]
MSDSNEPSALPNDQAERAKNHKASFKLEKIYRLCRKHRRGAAVVEFAIVAPIFFGFTLGMIEVGRGVMVQQILTNASREGARRAVLDGATTSDVTSFVSTYMSNASVSAAGLQTAISPSLPTASGYNGPVTVTVTVPFNQVTWGPSPIFLNGSTLTASTTMRREGVQ